MILHFNSFSDEVHLVINHNSLRRCAGICDNKMLTSEIFLLLPKDLTIIFYSLYFVCFSCLVVLE